MAELIHKYTRAQAIEDGVLVDVNEMATEAGITFHAAMTSSLYDVMVPTDAMDGYGQSVEGRLWDCLWMLHMAIRGSIPSTVESYGPGQELRYKFLALNDDLETVEVEVKAITGPGDNMEPVITLMHPHED